MFLLPSRSPSLCVSHSRSDSLYFCFVCVSVSLTSTVLSVCIRLSAFYRYCFKRTGPDIGGVSPLRPHPAHAVTLCYLRGKLVSAGSLANIIKLFMQRVWPLTITLLSDAGRGVYGFVCIRGREKGDSEAQASEAREAQRRVRLT